MPTDLATLARPTAVLFDLDGTLIDTVPVRIEAWRRTFERLGIAASREELAPLMGLDGRRLARDVAARAGRPIDEATSEEIDRECGELYERLNRAPRPLPGVVDVVDAITARDLRWAIATSSRKDQVSASVRALGLPLEPTIVDASHVRHAKPEPDLLLHAARELGVDPGTCWYVGDATWDMASAVAAGMIGVGVRAGSAVSAEALAGAGAAVVVDDLGAVARAIRAQGAS